VKSPHHKLAKFGKQQAQHRLAGLPLDGGTSVTD